MGAERAAQSGYLVDVSRAWSYPWSIFDVRAVPGNVSFGEDDEICFVRGRFTDKTDGFADGRFGIEEDWGDVTR